MKRALAVQLYSLREEAQKDFVGVLKKVADIGYQAVEPAGFWNLRPREFKKIIDDLGLKIFSSHSPWAGSFNLGEAMDLADALGLDKIVCGYGPNEFKDRDSIKYTAETTNKMQAILEKNGFILFQHNHDFEFQRIDGKLKYQIYAELCPKVKFQIDSFWSTNFGTEDEVEMLKLFADRTILIHIKDGILRQAQQELKVTNGTLDRQVDLRALGSGQLNIKGVVENLPERIDNIIVELDYCNIDMFTAIEQSYKFMTENGFAAGNK
ncbi:MAG: TIM barrel protein [Phycisphaerae bacterium]|jgi:sugar phosphate isomerase/epimerase|nr:TIM barrel protein [Phycisphaerae bacterium]